MTNYLFQVPDGRRKGRDMAGIVGVIVDAMPWPKLMLLRILDQVYHIQIKAVTVNVTSTMYTLGISLAASKVEGIGPTRIGQAEPASQTPGNTGFRTGKAPKISRFSKWARTWGTSARFRVPSFSEVTMT
jgi:hypothetical protein